MMITKLMMLVALAAFSQTSDVKAPPVETTICELLRIPQRFNGKMVTVRATVRSGFEFSILVDKNCEAAGAVTNSGADESFAGYEFAFIKSAVEIEHPERLRWQQFPAQDAIRVKTDAALTSLYQAMGEYYTVPGCLPLSCPKFSVEATFTGRFDFDNRGLRAVRSKTTGEVMVSNGGFGHLNASSNQLVWQGVTNVTATPISVAMYEKRK